MSKTSETRLQLPRINGVTSKPKHPTSPTVLQAPVRTTPSDSVHFGSHETDTSGSGKKEPTKEGTLHKIFYETPGFKHVNASLRGAYRGAFDGRWGLDIGLSIGTFLLTLPFALLIPGSHFLLIPGVIAARRGINAAKGAITGLFNPDKILKPKSAPDED